MLLIFLVCKKGVAEVGVEWRGGGGGGRIEVLKNEWCHTAAEVLLHAELEWRREN